MTSLSSLLGHVALKTLKHTLRCDKLLTVTFLQGAIDAPTSCIVAGKVLKLPLKSFHEILAVSIMLVISLMGSPTTLPAWVEAWFQTTAKLPKHDFPLTCCMIAPLISDFF
jgi:hypothetical protein